MHSLYKRAVDLEAGGTDVGLLEDDSASASSITEELSMRRSSSASPGISTLSQSSQHCTTLPCCTCSSKYC